MFIKEFRHGFRTLYFVTQVKDDKYFNALFRFDSLNRQMFFRLLKAVETFSCLHFDQTYDKRLVFIIAIVFHRFGLAAFSIAIVSLTMDWTVGSSLCRFTIDIYLSGLLARCQNAWSQDGGNMRVIANGVNR